MSFCLWNTTSSLWEIEERCPGIKSYSNCLDSSNQWEKSLIQWTKIQTSSSDVLIPTSENVRHTPVSANWKNEEIKCTKCRRRWIFSWIPLLLSSLSSFIPSYAFQMSPQCLLRCCFLRYFCCFVSHSCLPLVLLKRFFILPGRDETLAHPHLLSPSCYDQDPFPPVCVSSCLFACLSAVVVGEMLSQGSCDLLLSI